MKKTEYTEQYYKHLFEKLNEQAYLLEKLLKKKKQDVKKLKASKKLDSVGKEDEDIDNDGKPNTKTDKYLKARREAIKNAINKKKKVVKEGTIITDGNIFYGGFPKQLNESAEMHQELEKHLGTISRFGQELHKTNHPDRYKFGKVFDEFAKGNANRTDELLSMGADPQAVAGYLKISNNPEYKKHMQNIWSNKSPESMGYNRPSPNNWTGD